jgi:signal transduction histidine kinase
VGALQEELRRFSSDPSVVVAVWDAARAGFVDGEGCTIPQQSSGRRSVTVTDDDGRPLALVLHGGSLPEGTQLADAVRATVSLIASHAALRGALAERVEDVRRSRRRLLVAADAERHALSRQLALGPGSRLADLRRRIADVGTEEVLPPVTAELAAATRHLDGAADDLASIAAGLRPAELDDGLAPALAALADRSPVRVTLELQLAGAVPTEVATAAYYVAAEALANVAKHARATFVRLATFTVLENSGDVLVVRVTDDGTGDVRSKEGGGILGLADRAAALGGVVTALGSRGGGTVVEARLPIRPASSAS